MKDSRRATIACIHTTGQPSLSPGEPPLSDILDWDTAPSNNGLLWPATHTIRRVRSWVAGYTNGTNMSPPWVVDDGDNNSHSCKSTSVVVVEEAKPRWQLMSVFQIPAYMVEDHIWDSYRPLCFSYKECLRSWGYVHSEFGNIMTHIAGVILFVVLALLTGPVVMPYINRSRPQGAQPVGGAEYAVVYVYLLAVSFCLAASVAFHTLACHSKAKHFSSLRCDFIGILVLIVGSFVPIGYFGFIHSRHGILIGYMVMFVVVGVAGVLVSILGKVEDPRRANWRPVIFLATAFTGLVPVIHGAIINGYQGAVNQMSLWYVVGMAALYVCGTMIYTFKLPERYRPGQHNVCLHSHQIFHVMVVLAAVCHYVGIVRAMTWVHQHR